MLARIGLRLSDWFEKWFPDAFVLALAAVAVVFVACLLAGSSVLQTAQRFGSGFWDLVAFTIQMSMIVITGYAVATSPPVYGVIHRLAGDSAHRQGSGRVRRVVLDARVARVVELQPDLQRAARARGRAAREGLRLSRDRCGRVPRRRQRLGARPVVVRRADHGRAGVAAGRDREHQWRDSVGSDDRAVAEPGRGGGAHRRVDVRFVLLRTERRACALDDRHGRPVLARDERHRQAADAGRVARIQPASYDRRVCARLRLSRARDPRQGCEAWCWI